MSGVSLAAEEIYVSENLVVTPYRQFERVNGGWVERRTGAKNSQINSAICHLLGRYIEAHRTGLLFGSKCRYQIFPHKPKKVRQPDVSFVQRGRLPNDEPPDGDMTIPPDLAVEVVSPNDLAEELEERLGDYLSVGVPMVWVVYPKNRCVRVLKTGGEVARLTAADDLTGGDVLPGFSCRVERLFGTR